MCSDPPEAEHLTRKEMMAPRPPLTFSVWVAEIIRRWRLAALVSFATLTILALATLFLPPVYEARASFITPAAGATGDLQTGPTDAPAQSSTGSPDAAIQAPRHYIELLESEELRRRLLASRFADPRTSADHDSATLFQIMRSHRADSAREHEKASARLSRSIADSLDLSTNLVSVEVRTRWPELSAAVANTAVALADQYAQEQRSARALTRRIFLEARLDETRSQLAVAEDRLRAFESANRYWRTSPDLVATASRLSRDAGLAARRHRGVQRQLDIARIDERNDRMRVTVVDSAVVPRKAHWPRYGLLLLSGVATSLLLGLIAAGIVAFVGARRSVMPATEPEAESARSSFLSRFGFPLFAWGLVFHSLIITVLFGRFDLSVETVRSIAAWKEAALVAFLVIVMVRSLSGKGPRAVVTWPDLWVGGLLVTALLFLLTENLWLRLNLPRSAELLGFRDAVYFMLLYFVGRAMPELASKERAMKSLFLLVVVTSVIGVIERMIVSPEMLVGLGVAAYFQDFLGVSAFTAGNAYGLPLNYWTMIGGQLFRRAGSVYLSGQGFAVPFLLFFPLATAWVFLRPTRTRVLLVAYAVVSIALLLTLTRMTILIALIQLVLFVSLVRRPEWAVGGVTIAFLVFIAAFGLIPGFPEFVWQTISWQEGSSVSHMNDWLNGLAVFFQNPWGSGLGTADQTAVRAGLKHLTGDNLYLKYGVEMGALGLSLLVLTLAAIGRSALRLYRNGSSYAERRVGITLWLAAVGIAINGITAVVFSSITLGWLFFWLAGAAVTAAQALPAVARRAEASA